MIRKEGGHAGPNEVVSSISHNVGGVMGAVAPGQLPQDEMQVSNAKRQLQFSEKGGMSDELLIVMQKEKNRKFLCKGCQNRTRSSRHGMH